MSTRAPWFRRARRAAGRLRSGAARARPSPRLSPEDLVWIMGSPRTGSTWVLNLLAALTDGVRIDEPWIAPHLGTPSTVLPGWPEATARPLFEVARERPGYLFADAHEDIWAPAIADIVLRRFAAAVPPHRQGPVFVKEPIGATGAPLLMRCLPRTRLLFLVRDGRDVVDSLLDALDGGWVTELAGIRVDQTGRRPLLESCARAWVRDIDAVQRAYDARPADRRILVRYEDLRAGPEQEVDRILRWLGEPVDPVTLRDGVARLQFDRVPESQRGAGKFQRAAQPGLWRERFDEAERALLQETMGDMLARYGYA